MYENEMMNKNMEGGYRIRRKIETLILEAINNYNFEDAIIEALDSISIMKMVACKVEEAIEEIDITEMAERAIENSVKDAISELDFEDVIEEAIIEQIYN